MLPLLCFGTLTTEEKFIELAKARNEPEEFPAVPGVFSLQAPYEKVVLVLSDNCPARYVNDCKGVNAATPNIMFVQHPDPRMLFHDKQKGIHLLLQAQCTRDIAAGEQLFTPYGEKFWKEHAPIYRKAIDENSLLSPGEVQEVDETDVFIDLTDAKIQTPKRVLLNKSTLSQDEVPVTLMSSPVTPVQSPSTIDVSSVLGEDNLQVSGSGKPRKRAKTAVTDLNTFPQGTSPPA